MEESYILGALTQPARQCYSTSNHAKIACSARARCAWPKSADLFRILQNSARARLQLGSESLRPTLGFKHDIGSTAQRRRILHLEEHALLKARLVQEVARGRSIRYGLLVNLHDQCATAQTGLRSQAPRLDIGNHDP